MGQPVPGPRAGGPVRVDELGRVQVYVQIAAGAGPEAATEVRDRIEAVGGRVDTEGLGIVQAWIPIPRLESVASMPAVRYVRPPDYGHFNIGSVTTQGDAALGASQVREQFGATGQGVRVGVISDGVTGLPEAIASSNLPATTFHCQLGALPVTLRAGGCLAGEKLVQTTGGVTALPFVSSQDLAAGAEGTAMLEIIRDLAPGAELWFANVDTQLEYASAASWLATNVDVIVSDVTYPGYFPNGDSTLARGASQIVNHPAHRARAFVVATGNHALGHYSGMYQASDLDDGFGKYHLFSATSETTGPGSPATANRVTVSPGLVLRIWLSWDDPAMASANDYDLELRDCGTGTLLDWSGEAQTGSQEPQEFIAWPNLSLASTDVCYAIQNFLDLAAPRMLNVILNLGHGVQLFNTLSRSLSSPADTPGDIIAVGAVPASSPSAIEPFSSRGPTFDGRAKPDLVATDAVSVSGVGGFPETFIGTSAAAPHVAGVAALLLQLNPGLSRGQLKTLLQESAVTLGDVHTFGAGRVDALAAATLAASQTLALAAAVLPGSRSVQVGATATAFATILAAGTGTGTGCGIAPLTSIPATFQYQTTNPATNELTGTPNTPASIPAGGSQTFVVAFTPAAPFAPTEVQLGFDCANTLPAPAVVGLNSVLLSASVTPAPDIVALAATIGNSGIVDIAGANGTGVFSVATVNVGAGGAITASADTGAVPLPVTLVLCQTDPATGTCISAISSSVTTTIGGGQTPTFAVFAQGHGTVAFSPGVNRVFVRFRDGDGTTRGSTSVAVRTQ